jgi:mgtE-like transporter
VIIYKRFLLKTAQALFSLLFDFGGLLAGSILAYNLGIFESLPWALVIYPGILSIRGAIGGLFSGRLSTAMHLGTIKPRLMGNTSEAYALLNTVNALTLMSALFMGSIGSIICVVVTGTPLTTFPLILSVIVCSMGLSILIISPMTFWISTVAYRRGLDPDVILYPIVSTVADIVITFLYIGVLQAILKLGDMSWIFLNSINLVFIFTVLWAIRKIYRSEEFQSTFKEFMITLLFVSVIVNITGTALNSIIDVIGRRPEIFMIYPALIDTVGDIGSIVGSTATTKMALGTMLTKYGAILEHSLEIASAWVASVIMFILYAIFSSLANGVELPRLLLEVLTVHIIVVPLIILISYGTAIITRRRGLDPDNFIIPVETSLSDGLTTIGLLIAITFFV